MDVGLIGFGRFGQHIAKFLAQDFDLFVHDLGYIPRDVEKQGIKVSPLKRVCDCSVVISAVPISAFEPLLEKISADIKPGTLFVDVCSVKERPVNAMKNLLSPKVSILGTHPMFGPDSAGDTLFGTKVVLCPVRIGEKRYNDIKLYLNKHGMKVIDTTPEKHDQQISMSLLLTHFIGNVLMDMEVSALEIDTKGYRRLMKILETVEHDSWQLFEDMNKYNQFGKVARDKFIESITRVSNKLC